jgi:N-acetyl-alpha-D-muramate 1-phosphate uridylyltransferase
VPADLPPVCILAGGLGTRLGHRVRDTPKPLLEVAGEPFLLHQLRLLAAYGADRVVLCVGYLGDLIIDRIGTSQFGISIAYSHDGPEPIGTLAAVRKASELLGDRFLVLYGDTYLQLDYRAVAEGWELSGLPAVMTVLRNEGRWDRSNVEFDGQTVVVYDKHNPTPDMHWIDYGLGGLEHSTLDLVGPEINDLAELYHVLAERSELLGYTVTERFYEIGTTDALAETSAFLASLPRDAE